jgi:fructose-1,6-bisphosphatase/inositol monophosphatase family enzyme
VKIGAIVDQVADALRVATATFVEPRFNALAEGDVEEKSAGELVTIADREAEAAIEASLAAILPAAPIIGEEACSADPARLELLGAPRAWLVDALDGTRNFVEGSPDWATMVALVEDRRPVMSWIWQPLTGRMYVAVRGSGSSCNGKDISVSACPKARGELRGAALTRFMDPTTAAAVARNAAQFGEIGSAQRCAGIRYPGIVEGDEDFAVFWRTLPWDHLPGALLLEEAGGIARRPTGEPFLPFRDGQGLLVAANEHTWREARHLLD